MVLEERAPKLAMADGTRGRRGSRRGRRGSRPSPRDWPLVTAEPRWGAELSLADAAAREPCQPRAPGRLCGPQGRASETARSSSANLDIACYIFSALKTYLKNKLHDLKA